MSQSAFVAPVPPAVAPLRAARPSNRSNRRRSAPQRSRMPPRATIAAPSDPVHAAPDAEPEPGSAPWMPLPGVVHEIASPEQFDVLLATSRDAGALLVADFMASWCRKCLYLLPRLRKAAAKAQNVYFCTVDVNKVKRLPKEHQIAKMPTFIFFRGGERIETLIGGEAPQKVAEVLTAKIDKFSEAS